MSFEKYELLFTRVLNPLTEQGLISRVLENSEVQRADLVAVAFGTDQGEINDVFLTGRGEREASEERLAACYEKLGEVLPDGKKLSRLGDNLVGCSRAIDNSIGSPEFVNLGGLPAEAQPNRYMACYVLKKAIEPEE